MLERRLVSERVLGDTSTEVSVVAHQLNGTLGLSLGLFDRVVVDGGLPLVLVMDGADAERLVGLGAAPPDGAGLGDAYLGARVRLLGEADEVFALALQATVTFPTSGGSAYRGDPSVTFQPELVAELRPGAGLRVVVDVGARVREESSTDVANLAFGHELTYALGLGLPVWTDEHATTTHLDVVAQIRCDASSCVSV